MDHTEQKAKKLADRYVAILCSSDVPTLRFFGIHIAKLKRVVTRSVKTQAVDGVSWFINPEWTIGRTDHDNLFTVIHEAFHVAAGHPVRLRDAAPGQKDLVNKAADYAINLALEQDRTVPYPMPEDGLLDRKYVDQDGRALNAERILRLLLDELPPPEQPSECGDGEEGEGEGEGQQSTSQDTGDSETGETQGTDDQGEAGENAVSPAAGNQPGDSEGGSCGELLPAPDDYDQEAAQQTTAQAAQLAKSAGAGYFPDYLQELAESQLVTAKRDWLSELRNRFATVIDRSDYSFRKFNNRYAHFGLIAPSLHNPGIGKVAIVGDESGSMSDEELAHATSQSLAVVEEWSPSEVLIVRHTTEVVYTEELTKGQLPTERKSRSYGGTYFNPVIDLCEKEQVSVIIWITDCYPCDRVRKDHDIPIIWLATEGRWPWNAYDLGGEFIDLS